MSDEENKKLQPFQIDSELARPGITATRVGLDISHNISFEDWVDFGRKIVNAGSSLNWIIGDWAAFGDIKFGALEKWCDANGRDYSYVLNLSWVASNVKLSLRSENLTFSHHREVAALSEPEQKKWLAIADEERLSVVDLRRRIRAVPDDQSAMISDGPEARTYGAKLDAVKAFLFHQSDDWWDSERRQIWKERLRPVVEFYQKL